VAGWATLIPTAEGRAAARDGRQRIVNVSEDRLMSTRARLVLVALTVVAATLVTRPAAAQLPDKFTNLTVLPKDVSKEQLGQIMRAFSGGLGVRCSFCHVERTDGPGMDFAKDDKPEKGDARLMMKMVGAINGDTLTKLSDPSDRRVGCETCHRGEKTPPSPMADVLTEAVKNEGVPAALAKYRDLREKSLDAGLYDFRDRSFVTASRRLHDEKRQDDATTLLKAAATDIFPKSADLAAALGGALAEAGDTAGAKAEFERALSLDPNNVPAKMGLDRLTRPAGAPVGLPPRPPR
jgi:Photosynthetic reaction centre cytochrome C subunit